MGIEVEAAPLYAFVRVRSNSVLCVNDVTNRSGRIDNDFENDRAEVSHDALQLTAIAADRRRSRLWP
jgi:hypothetical protein